MLQQGLTSLCYFINGGSMKAVDWRKRILTIFLCLVCGILSPHMSALALTVSYGYDAAGRLTQVQYSNLQQAAFAYDDAGNIVSQIVAGATAAVSPVMLLLQEKTGSAWNMETLGP